MRDTSDTMEKDTGGTSKQASMTRPPKPGSARATSVVGQERESLLARAVAQQPHRSRSGSYGSRGDQAGLPLGSSINSSGSNVSNGAPAHQTSKAKLSRVGSVTTSSSEEDVIKVAKPGGVKAGGAKDGTTLVTAFVVMIFVGTGNRVFMKLQTYPMYNYPFFLTMLSTFIYVPVCFMYIIPMLMFGSAITPAQQAIPKFKFAVMGLLDSVAGIMGVFAVNYITNAAVIVLLQQAAIPISMSISRFFLGACYTISQYVGASVVIAGIIVTLIPTFFGHTTAAADGSEVDTTTQIMWSGVQVLSCIPMCLSSVYKEKALGDDDMDVIYLNGWVAVFQFMASLLFAVPSAYAMGLPIAGLPLNIYQGYRCFMGHDSHYANMANMASGLGAIPADHCEMAPFFVSMYLCFNLVYNVMLIVILKYGSANVLFLASTVMVPIGNVAFSLKFVPNHQDLKPSDTAGLLFILTGLVVYRFSTPLLALLRGPPSSKSPNLELDGGIPTNDKISTFVGINQLEYLEPLVRSRLWKARKARLLRSPEQIRSSFMHRLGLPPSPMVSATPTSGSPYIGRVPARGRGLVNPRASPGAYWTSRSSRTGYSTIPNARRASISDTPTEGGTRKAFLADGVEQA